MAGKPLMEKKVSMKITSSREDGEPMVDSDQSYPYGLRITLDNESLKKLGMPGLPDVGEKLCIDADVTVISVQSVEEKDGARSSVELQITGLMFCDPETEKREAHEVLYDGNAASK